MTRQRRHSKRERWLETPAVSGHRRIGRLGYSMATRYTVTSSVLKTGFR